MTGNYEYDFFVSHASEDKDVAEPLVQKLAGTGARVWYDRIVLTIGDSLRRKIDEGLANSRYGIVILSPRFLEKDWPQRELDGLAALEVNGRKVILPVWHDIAADGVRRYSPTLSDRFAAKTALGLDSVVNEILRAAGMGGALIGETSRAPDIEVPPVGNVERPALEERPLLLLGSSPLRVLEDEAFMMISAGEGPKCERRIAAEVRALRVALFDNRSVATLVGETASEYLLIDPEVRVKESLDRVPALAAGLSETEEGRSIATNLLSKLAEFYSMVPPGTNRRVNDPLGVQQRFLYSAYGVGAIAVDRNWPALARGLVRWPNAAETYWDDRSWIRYVATMLAKQNIVRKSVISSVKEHEPLAQYLGDRLGGEEGAWDRLCQFDFLQCADNVASGGDLRDCFASFSVFRRSRVQPMVERLIDTCADGTWLPVLEGRALAELIAELDNYAGKWASFENDTWAIDRWSSAKVRMFLTQHGIAVR